LKRNDVKANDSDGSKSDHREKPDKSILSRFLMMIHKVLDIFEDQPLSETPDSYKIETKYPKYIPEYKLINLQFNDFQFRQTFMAQILILLQSLRQPVNVLQTKYFKISDTKPLLKTKTRIYSLLSGDNAPNDVKTGMISLI
jgi:hypothetical protein